MVAAAIVTDGLAIAAAYGTAAALRYPPDTLRESLLAPQGVAMLGLGTLLWLAALSARASYAPRSMVSVTDQIGRVLSAAVPAWILTQLLAFAVKVPIPFESRLVAGISLVLVLAALPAFRVFLVRPIARRVYPRLTRGPVLVLGDSVRADRIAERCASHDARRRPVIRAPLRDLTPERVAGQIDRLGIGEVILVPDGLHLGEALDLAFACLDARAEVRIASTQFDVLSGRSAIGELEGAPVMHFRRMDLVGPEALLRRAIDVLGSAVGLMLLAPVLATIALGVKGSSPGPVLFKQVRIGKGGRPFTMYKFRTMAAGNDPGVHHEYIRSFIRGGAAADVSEDGTKIYKLTKDPRVTRLGALLRAFSLDELPQLWNVLRGDMSLVGPRPCLPLEWELYEPWQRRRLDVLPGCTGLWQVTGRSQVTFEEMVLLDLHYAHQSSVGRDLWLIAQTVPAMVRAHGGY